MSRPELINGGQHTDHRGTVIFMNEFDMSPVKRVYFAEHTDTEVVRAWQAHAQERRWFFCVKGAFSLRLVQIDDFNNPSENLVSHNYTLSENTPQVLCAPAGYANGFRALDPNSKLAIFADAHLGENPDDQYRYDKNKWAQWS